MAQAPQPLIDLCAGLGVRLPVLQPVAGVASGLLGGVLDPVLNQVVGNVNTNLTSALSGQTLGLTAVDQNGNAVTFPSSNCNVGANSFTLNANRGLSLGGGRIDGLGGSANTPAVAGDISAIAFGNGATTGSGVANAIALGANASATVAGGVALGSGSAATRLNAANEFFSGSVAGLNSALGAISVGSASSPRQITNVAGGTLDTDAANIRQVRSVGAGLSTALGGGAGFSSTTGAFTSPGYAIRGTTYNDVGSALHALDTAIGNGGGGGGGGTAYPIVGNSPDGTAQPSAGGANSVAGGYQASSSGAASTALGDATMAAGDFSVSVGGQSQAMGLGSTALGAQSMAMGTESNAIGGRSVARFAGSVAIGSYAQAIADPTTAVGYYSTASGDNSVAFGANSLSTGDSATALGTDSSATGAGAIALGRFANASASGGVAIGTGAVADRMNGAAEAFSGAALRTTLGTVSFGSSGNERQLTNVAGGTADTDAVNLRQLRSVGNDLADALGGGSAYSASSVFAGPSYAIRGGIYTDVGSALAALAEVSNVANVPVAANNTSGHANPTATGSDAVALGYGGSAGGARATALGTQASAGGDDGVAIGAGANAGQAGAVAIGRNVTTTRTNQIAIGGAGSTYTLAGIGSAQSAAAQSGPTRIVTADAAGNLATANFDPNEGIGAVLRYAGAARTEARQGIAASMAMTAAPMPSAGGRTSWAMNGASFRGEWAGGVGFAHRLDVAIPFALTASYSVSGGSSHGVRFGMAGEF